MAFPQGAPSRKRARSSLALPNMFAAGARHRLDLSFRCGENPIYVSVIRDLAATSVPFRTSQAFEEVL